MCEVKWEVIKLVCLSRSPLEEGSYGGSACSASPTVGRARGAHAVLRGGGGGRRRAWHMRLFFLEASETRVKNSLIL